ncbi:MAG: CoA transferase [Deltaproteobacteria bacterium]|nr:CoA transferase [Deltaproteobacteria bacterium]
MSRALAGIRVVDLTIETWGGIGAALLGDFGAEVIRVDALGPSPAVGPEDERAPGTWNAHAALAQRNKRSLAVDLASTAGRELVQALVGKADVVITDRARADLLRLGLDHAALCARKPDLIYARGSGFGPQGPDADLPAIDELAAARTGMMPILPQPGRPPVFPGHGQMYTAVMLAFGILAALHHRAKTGEGQEVDASLLGGNMYGASLDLQAYLAIGGERMLRPISRLDAGNPMSGTMYMSADGPWVTLTMPDTDRWWPVFAPLVELAVDDPRFDTHDKRCGANRLEMMQVLEAAFRRAPAAHWRAMFQEHQLSADIIESYDFPAADPQVYRNRYFVEIDDPSFGPRTSLGFPIFMSGTPARLDGAAPARGQHGAAILHDLLGLSEDAITALRDAGTIAG